MSTVAEVHPHVKGPSPLVFRVGTSITLNLVLRNQMRLLAREEWRICCVCDDDKWATELCELGFEQRLLGMGRRPGLTAALLWGLGFWRLCRRERPAIVHTHNAFHGLVGRIAARLAGVPIIIQTVHNWYFLEPPSALRPRIFRGLERIAGYFSHMILFINAEDFERAKSERIVHPNKRRFIGNGIDVEGLERELKAIDRTAARRALDIADEETVLSMIARLEPPKDHELLLRALPTVVAEIPRLRVLLAGHGLHTERIRRRISELRLGDRVSILGQRDDVPTILRASDALVLTSMYEGFGRCLVEGMVARLPVIATDVVGVRDVIVPDETGILVPYGDRTKLASALVRVLRGGADVDDMAARGQQEARTHFAEDIPAKRVGEVYAELLAQQAAARSPTAVRL